MFTTYIHTLEVLAMHPEGTTVRKIVEMGCEYSQQKIHSTLQSLMDEGYVTCDDSGSVNIWQMTEKAAEYCETVARKYAASHVMDDIAAYVEGASKNAIAPSQDAITEISETPQDLNVMSTSFTMPLMGELTIAEVVEGIEKTPDTKVTRAELENGIVTLTVEGPSPEYPECSQCGQSLDTEMELKSGVCLDCMWWV
jgi:hypothetical protein